MWMMSYSNDEEGTLNVRKLRPLMPRPPPASTPMTPHLCLNRAACTDLFSLNHSLCSYGGAVEPNKKEFGAQPVIVSSRWNPTPEQLHALEELYRNGTRTPSSEQIQHITNQLRRYGKIEGKNVFYWFQNHKARERQKRRRQMESDDHRKTSEKKESEAGRTIGEVEQTKKWVTPTKCGTLIVEESDPSSPTQRAAKAAPAVVPETGSPLERNARWHMMQLSCPFPTPLINTSTGVSTTPMGASEKMDPYLNFIKSQDLNFFAAPPYRSGQDVNWLNRAGGNDDDDNGDCCSEEGRVEAHTLQLFPLRKDDVVEESIAENEVSAAAISTGFSPCHHQFIEFLPVKN